MSEVTKEAIEATLVTISMEAGVSDFEVAHGVEKHLWEKVLRHIADGGEDAPKLAALALKSLEIEFIRVYS